MPKGDAVVESLQSVQPALSVDPVTLEPAEALHIALQLHQKGLLNEAEMLYHRILDVGPKTLDALHFLGLLCHQQSRHEEAVALIERIIFLAPNNADAHNNLGNVLEGLGKSDEAEACYRKAIELRPDHANAFNNLGVILSARKMMAEAVDAYRTATELAPDSVDFRYNLGNALRKSGALNEAVLVFREAIVLRPEHNGAWQGLARTYLMSDRRDLAAEVYEEWLRLYPGDPAILFSLSACRGEDAPSRAPESYIQQVFDNMSERFDSHLESLEYRVPDLIGEALAEVIPDPAANLDILDAGCGTGLCGPILRPYARLLTGIDLSSGMLNKAESRSAYDKLIRAELTAFIGRHTEEFDVIASADTLCYFGDLEPVFTACFKALKPGGFLAFTLEDSGSAGPDSLLSPHCRYSHSRPYVEGVLTAAGLGIDLFRKVFLRNEGGEPVAGHLVVAKKQPSA